MTRQRTVDSSATLSAKNVGGIDETTVEFSPGVTILVGRNATNRTSFLQALMAALGSQNVAVKGDADEAEVELTLGDEQYIRQLRRTETSVNATGEAYLVDPELADLFAFLLESNEARRAVATNADLRELIMRPVDIVEIESEIDRLVQQRQSVEQELSEVDDLKGKLPALQEKRSQLQQDVENKKTELDSIETEIVATDADIEETRDEKSELDDWLDDLHTKRSELDGIRYDLETERESQEALEQERREIETEQEALPEVPAGEVEELDAEISTLRERKQQLESEVNDLQSIIGFNEDMLADAGASAVANAGVSADGIVTDQLVDDEVTCWTCGSQVEQEQIKATIDRLKEQSQEKVGEMNRLEDEISELQSEQREYRQAQREHDRIENRLSELKAEIEQTEATIENLKGRRKQLTEEVEAVEAEVEELEDEDYGSILDLHKEANQLEYELGKLETDLERVESNVSEVEDRIGNQSDLEDRREKLNDEIEALRTKIERIEQGSIEGFNEHMDTVLELLDYANLERIWIEQVQREVWEGRRKVEQSVFELHVVRTSDSGVTYEDTVDHLSESEREVTGLVFALAGYLAHEVYEDLPFIILDSLEAIDSNRIAAMVEYLTEYTEYLLVALLPMDAAALPDEYDRVTDI
jgi:chromosome segregation ATPase